MKEIWEEIEYLLGIYGERVAVIGILLTLGWDLILFYLRAEVEYSLRGKAVAIWLLCCVLGWVGARVRDRY